ncbi:P-loop containing nucleoside triphosphate hydrolase protein [Staphylotrichum tortipilum]|uniref:GTP:AMP phosphotransferase, mitochondrial n=1 Tax=Staphylotrichum tortipilum TaxID=2831512 RepID=A0AAN6MEC6_9PEZI|nr:P-loop containing nucleoside triphosphate hydrolase protein [Staphylotrichum longicolle]
MRLRRAARVILVGAPGVGKGTQSERLLQRFPQLASISSGDLLRHNVKQRTPLGIKVESTMKAGGLVPDALILRLIGNELNQRGWISSGRPSDNIMTLSSSGLDTGAATADPTQDDASIAAFLSSPAHARGAFATQAQVNEDPSASFLLDGFPRTAAQAAQLDALVPINLAVSIRTPLEVIVARIGGRWVHEPSGRVYNTSFNAPRVEGRDDVTGEPLVRRADDSEEVYRARWDKFRETSEPLLEHYAKKGVLWEVEGLSSDEITPKLVREFERRFAE